MRSYRQQLLDVFFSYRNRSAPVTNLLLGIIIGVFAVEVGLSLYTPIESTRIFATGIFDVRPVAAWIGSPFLHSDLLHFLTNAFGLIVMGLAIEPEWDRWRYIIFTLVAGYGATFFGAALLLVFSEKQIAFYGASGIVYAYGGFALIHYLPLNQPRDIPELVSILFGLTAVLTIIIDVVGGPFFRLNG